MILCQRQSCISVLVSVAMACGTSVSGAPADKPDASLNEMLELYLKYGLPLPPNEAKLVRIESGWSSYVRKGEELPLDFLGFLLKPPTAGHPAVALVGTREITLRSVELKILPVEPNPALAKDPTITEDRYLFDLTSNFALALQCKSRCWDDLARALLDRRPAVMTVEFDPRSPRSSVARLAWMHWRNKLVDPDSDWAGIAERMQALLEHERGFTEKDRALLTSLKKSLKPSKAKAGSIEAMIDHLVSLRQTEIPLREGDPEFKRLRRMGFEAFPVLIEHWDDPRLTGLARPAFMNYPGDHVFVRDLVRSIVTDLAGDGLAEGDESKKADVLAWWAKAQRIGEEKYLVSRVIPADAQADSPQLAMLQIIGRKYPQELPALYLAILEKRPLMQSAGAVKIIGDSSLPRDTKLRLLNRGASDADLEHRRAALWRLKDLDPQRFLDVLIATLESLPATPREPYWKCREAAFANLVMETDDPRAWSTLEKVAKRSDVGLRMEFMKPMNYAYIGDRQRTQRVQFLSRFLDDDAVRDVTSNPSLFEGPYAAFRIAKIKVRNFAAQQIAYILRLSVKPDEDRTPEQWSALRAQVRQALERKPAREPDEAVR